MTELARLVLDYTEIGDKGLTQIGNLKALATLSLDSTHVTDSSIDVMKRFSRLGRLNLYHTLVTDKGFGQLRQALPDCHVVFDAESSLPNRRRS